MQKLIKFYLSITLFLFIYSCNETNTKEEKGLSLVGDESRLTNSNSYLNKVLESLNILAFDIKATTKSPENSSLITAMKDLSFKINILKESKNNKKKSFDELFSLIHKLKETLSTCIYDPKVLDPILKKTELINLGIGAHNEGKNGVTLILLSTSIDDPSIVNELSEIKAYNLNDFPKTSSLSIIYKKQAKALSNMEKNNCNSLEKIKPTEEIKNLQSQLVESIKDDIIASKTAYENELKQSIKKLELYIKAIINNKENYPPPADIPYTLGEYQKELARKRKELKDFQQPRGLYSTKPSILDLR